jgi:hypothetical protein
MGSTFFLQQGNVLSCGPILALRPSNCNTPWTFILSIKPGQGQFELSTTPLPKAARVTGSFTETPCQTLTCFLYMLPMATIFARILLAMSSISMSNG